MRDKIKKKKHGMHWLLALVLSFVISILLETAFLLLLRRTAGTIESMITNCVWVGIWVLLTGRRYGDSSTWFNFTFWFLGVARSILSIGGAYNYSILYGQSMFSSIVTSIVFVFVDYLLCKFGQGMRQKALMADNVKPYKPLYADPDENKEDDEDIIWIDDNGFNPPERTDVPHYDQ